MNRIEIRKYTGVEQMTVVDAMRAIDNTGQGILFVIDDDMRLIGSLTDGDIRRWLIQTGNLDVTIEKMMQRHPIYLNVDANDKAVTYMIKNHIKALPLVDASHRIVDIIFNTYEAHSLNEHRISQSLMGIPVVVMAGGKGTRLYPYTKILPKPLIPVGDDPIIEHIIHRFQKFGCSEYYLVVNHKKNMIKAYFNEIDHDYTIEYVDEDKPLGTGGGLSLLKGRINRTFILSNCDIIIDADFSKIYQYHLENQNMITMICSLKNYPIPYGVVHLGDGGTIDKMEEKPTVSFFTNTGCYIVEPDVINSIPADTAIGFPDIIEAYTKNNIKVGVYPISERAWMDMGQMDTFEDMRKRLVDDKEHF